MKIVRLLSAAAVFAGAVVAVPSVRGDDTWFGFSSAGARFFRVEVSLP